MCRRLVQVHPCTGEPYYSVHPCDTAKQLQLLMAARRCVDEDVASAGTIVPDPWSVLLTWWSLYCHVVRVRLNTAVWSRASSHPAS